MATRPDIPLQCYELWREVRAQRAVLRQRLRERVEEFWKAFPRRRRRVMPVITYGQDSNWFEHEPVEGMEPPDRLGLALRWRVSGVIPQRKSAGPGDRPPLKAIWEFDLPQDAGAPSQGMLGAGQITDPADIENYLFLWRQIKALYEHYVWVGRWFEQTVRQVNELREQVGKHLDKHEIQKRTDEILSRWTDGAALQSREAKGER